MTYNGWENIMNRNKTVTTALTAAMGILIGSNVAATEPCGDFGECKVLVEINASDGDIGFHFLVDGDNLRRAALFNPNHRKLFSYMTRRELGEQYLTETFAESAEPLCFDPETDDDDENDDEDFVTLEEFLDRWDAGTYHFFGIGDGWELSFGASELTFNLPAAPAELEYEEGEISWLRGEDLGECSEGMELLPTPPAEVPVAVWEVVLEPDVDGIVGSYTYVVRIPGDAEELAIEVPEDYLETLPDNTPVKIEVGAIGIDDNATFSEEDEFCVNETEENGCGFDEEEG
jgi:hypothetical protein